MVRARHGPVGQTLSSHRLTRSPRSCGSCAASAWSTASCSSRGAGAQRVIDHPDDARATPPWEARVGRTTVYDAFLLRPPADRPAAGRGPPCSRNGGTPQDAASCHRALRAGPARRSRSSTPPIWPLAALRPAPVAGLGRCCGLSTAQPFVALLVGCLLLNHRRGRVPRARDASAALPRHDRDGDRRRSASDPWAGVLVGRLDERTPAPRSTAGSASRSPRSRDADRGARLGLRRAQRLPARALGCPRSSCSTSSSRSAAR